MSFVTVILPEHVKLKAFTRYEAKHHQKSSQTLIMLALPYSPLCVGQKLIFMCCSYGCYKNTFKTKYKLNPAEN